MDNLLYILQQRSFYGAQGSCQALYNVKSKLGCLFKVPLTSFLESLSKQTGNGALPR